MLGQINIIDGSVNRSKITYKNPEDIEFASLGDYMLIAKKCISKYANKFYTGLAPKMLKDEDAVSSVTHAIIMADWRWDNEYDIKNGNGKKRNKHSYRKQCGIWAIKTYITKTCNNNYPHTISLDKSLNDDSLSFYDCTVNTKSKTAESILIDIDEQTELNNLINELLNSDFLGEKQRTYIRLYYLEGMTFAEIANQYGCCKETVRQNIYKGINLLKELV